ncbi:hypothetical protein CHELA40_11471 [Chelatococcus asaccharovorans]|nr:hypothetical protein CHELA40_11471 [Chelatococcus asaccharovorans]CAH1684701.1 hypothetical protein CHELA17_64131 [Chelatococcus asaccharovorans]
MFNDIFISAAFYIRFVFVRRFTAERCLREGCGSLSRYVGARAGRADGVVREVPSTPMEVRSRSGSDRISRGHPIR